MKKTRIDWLAKPKAEDLAAAQAYLSLLYGDAGAKALAAKLRRAALRMHKADDVLRAAELPPADRGTGEDRKKIRAGKKLPPVLLVRDAGRARLVIADGYHRLSAVYDADDEATVACAIVGL